MTKAEELAAILAVLKEHDLSSVKLKMGELELECNFPSKQVANQGKRNPKMQFPEIKYGAATLTDRSITSEEMQELGFAGVIPMNTPLSDLLPKDDKKDS